MTLFLTALLVLANTFTPPMLQRTVPLDNPPNVVGSSWVVLDATTGAQGSIQSAELLYGSSPFLEVALSNMRQWVFAPAANPLPTESRVTVIFLFRPRDLFASPQLGLQPAFRHRVDRSTFPLELRDPGYNPMSVGEGTVVLELKVAATGVIENVRVVSDAPGLAAHTENAVRSWRFEPALRNGSLSAGTVIVVASYFRPMLYNNSIPYAPYPPYQGPPAPITQPPTGIFNDKPGALAPPPL